MHPLFLARLLWYRKLLAGREHWTRGELEAHQARSLARLRTHALAHSRFYRTFHRGLESAPLASLPILTKAALMENFDAVAARPGISRKRAEAHLGNPEAPPRFLGRYVLSVTSGTTGRRGIFLHDPAEWAWIAASYARSSDWAGMKAGITKPVRMAVVSTRTRWHQSALIGSSLAGRIVPSLRLDATDTLESMVRELNAFRPRTLAGYPSVLRRLAAERIAGKLDIRPEAIFPAAEALLPEDRSLLRQAFGSEPFDIYGATETGCIASECRSHTGLHLHEDQVLLENVDEKNRPVPAGEFGAKVLATVLFSRTLPLIRYAITDSLRISDRACTCGRAFALIDAIQGRAEDVLHFEGMHGQGPIEIHPNLFHNLLEAAPIREWQVVQVGAGALRILAAGLEPGFDMGPVVAEAAAAIAAQGAKVDVGWEKVDAIPKGSTGKTSLVRALRSKTAS